jgi:hypothetical protein
LRNLSLIKNESSFPADSLTISLIDVKGDINNKAQGFFFEARYAAGPVPMDLPNNIIEDSGIPEIIVR